MIQKPLVLQEVFLYLYMSKKSDSNILSLFFSLGTIWVSYQLAKKVNHASIGALPNSFRKLIPYEDNQSNKVFLEELKSFTIDEQGDIIRLIMKGRLAENLSMPLYKPFKSNIITGELRANQFRIILYQINNESYLMISCFKKKSNETPASEISKAERRIKEYLSRK